MGGGRSYASTISKIGPMTRKEFVQGSGTAGLVIGVGGAARLEPANQCRSR